MAHYTADNPAHIGTVVHLNGVEITHVLECDTSEGWLIRAKLDQEGRMFLDGDDVATEILTGIVTAYPSTPRLSPDAGTYICDQCGKEWEPGQTPDCQPCGDAWARIEAKG